MKLHYLNFLEELNTDIPVHLIPDNGLAVQLNCTATYKMGAILKRLGYSRVGAALQASKSITGLHHFHQSASIQKVLATVNNSADNALQLFYSSGGAGTPGNWTELTDAETAWTGIEDAKVEMEDFLGYCFFVGYDSTDAVWLPNRTLTGTTFGTTNITSMPNAKYIKRYRDRLYLANCYSGSTAYPYRVYFSSVPSGTTITWTVATDFIDVDYSEEITGVGENWDRFIIFTEYSTYIYNQDELKKFWDIGCSNHRTIKNIGVSTLWTNDDGVWESINGGRPQNVAGRFIDFIRNSTPRNLFAETIDEEYHLYLGTVTVNGITYTNAEVVYDTRTKTCRINERFDNFTIYASVNSSGKQYLYAGDTDGEVQIMSKYTDTTPVYADAITTTDTVGKPIQAWFQTKAFDFGDPSSIKKINKLVAYADRAQGLSLRGRSVDASTQVITEFKDLGQLEKYVNELSGKNLKGYFIQLEGSENSKNPYWSFYGFTIFLDADTISKT